MVDGQRQARDITLDGASNDFQGTVNADGRNITLVDGVGGLELGDISASGDLDATSTDGAITQADGSTMEVGGDASFEASQMVDGQRQARDITLDGASNDFQGTVNADGRNITLVDGVGGLELGDISASGDLLLASVGPMSLGVTTVGGDMNLNSGNGNITQTGPLVVAGLSRIVAGTGVVSLGNPANRLPQGVTVQATRYQVAGDGSRAAAEIQGRVQGSRPMFAALGTALSNANVPPPLVLVAAVSAPAAPSSGGGGGGSGAGGAGSAGPAADSAGVVIDLRAGTANANLMAAVTLPRGTAVVGTGFSFALPASVQAMATPGTPVEARLLDGSPLPQ